jgi:methylated-DNA-[protein]-cysteine S-methyltransferase
MKRTDTFRQRVLAVVRKIPKGKVLSYGQVANAAGYPRAARAVGTLMAGNHDTTVPCHRVVRSDGRIGEYNGGGPNAKVTRLLSEGVRIHGMRVAPRHMLARS